MVAVAPAARRALTAAAEVTPTPEASAWPTTDTEYPAVIIAAARKSLHELVDDLLAEVGPVFYDRTDLRLSQPVAKSEMTDFLVKANPKGYACLNDKLHGRTNKQNIGDGSNMTDVHREAFKECIGMTYAEFEAAWIQWVGDTYTAMPP